MNIRRQLSMTKYMYWLKSIQSLKSHFYLKHKMLNIDLDANKTYNKTNWAYHMKLLLDTCGLSYLWIN